MTGRTNASAGAPLGIDSIASGRSGGIFPSNGSSSVTLYNQKIGTLVCVSVQTQGNSNPTSLYINVSGLQQISERQTNYNASFAQGFGTVRTGWYIVTAQTFTVTCGSNMSGTFSVN